MKFTQSGPPVSMIDAAHVASSSQTRGAVLIVARQFLLALLAFVSVCATAQVRTAFPAERGLKLSDFPRVIPLGPDVYAYEDIREPGFTTVSLFVVGANGVLIADGQGSPAAMQRLIDNIAKVTGKPIKWYVVGSNHGDHTGGNSILPRDVRYIVSPVSKAELERDAAAAKLKPGTPPVVVPPTAMASTTETIDVGGKVVQVLSLGRAHTGGDLVVYVPSKRILFLSEVGFNRVFPAMRSSYPQEWVSAVDKALKMDVAQYVPGHGFVDAPARSRENLVEFRAALAYVIGEARRLHRLGLSVDDAMKQADWGPYGSWMFADSQKVVAIRRVYDEAEGRLP
jgi:glyoxylase-like metal-dependent hydrolase (beta-lactamase superfamily II)